MLRISNRELFYVPKDLIAYKMEGEEKKIHVSVQSELLDSLQPLEAAGANTFMPFGFNGMKMARTVVPWPPFYHMY